jgi:type I restriction enzyme M protein
MSNNFSEKVNFIWGVANILRGTYRKHEYQDVVLPLVVLRRLDAVLEPTKGDVLKRNEDLEERGVQDKRKLLEKASGHAFYNLSEFTFKRLAEDPGNIAENLKAYMNGFSRNVREILRNFEFEREIDRLEDANLLFKVVQKFKDVDFHPDHVSNHEMGTIFEELIRRFAEETGEDAGEHFTPREIIRLMARIIIEGNGDVEEHDIIRKVFDPACGTGGMLTIAKDEIASLNETADVFLYGQELNPKTHAIAKADMLIKGDDADKIRQGNSFTEDQFDKLDDTFHYMLTNPPFGVSWGQYRGPIEREHEEGDRRFDAGLPRVSDGQLLFLQHMASKMKPADKGGSRIAIVFNGSPLFTGDAGSGESEIRKWLLDKDEENDMLEAIIGLPDQLFYNTGISTYIWIITNKKHPEREGKVQLIDAREMYVDMKKSLGNKRHEIANEQIDKIVDIYSRFEESDVSKIYDNDFFGYKKVTIERPQQLRIEVEDEGFAALKEERTFKADTTGDETRENLLEVLEEMQGQTYMDANKFLGALSEKMEERDDSLRASLRKAVLRSFGEHDEEAKVVTKSNGEPKASSDLRDYERIPLNESIEEYFDREVKPHVQNAWVKEDEDEANVGYEINFTKYFYEYEPPRALEEIQADIKELEKESDDLMSEILKV